MAQASYKNWFIILLVVLFLTACVPPAPGKVQPTPNVSSTSASAAQNEVIAPTETPTSLPTPTTKPVQKDTAVPTATQPAEVVLKPLGKTNCRSLPYETSLVVGYLRYGETAVAIGKDARSEWYLIQNPGKSENYCWIAAIAVNVEGDPDALPFRSAVQ